jgi:hypothetical protein
VIFLSSFDRERKIDGDSEIKWNVEESEMIEFQFWSRGEVRFDVVMVL